MTDEILKRFFHHNGISYTIEGSETVAMSHFHELRAHMANLKLTNVRNLPILSSRKVFMDGTEADFMLVHGIEKVTVYSPVPIVKEEEEVPEYGEDSRIVPCFIVTGGEGESRKVVGYIACIGGTFLGPYKWFSVVGDDEILLDSFYDEGDKYYDSEIALNHMGLLSTDNDDDSLLFFRQSGLSPAEDRESEGSSTQTGGLVQACTDFEFVTDADNWWAWSFAMANIVRGGESEYFWNTQFDGSAIFVKYFSRVNYGGSDYASVDERICSASDGPCLDDAQEWRDGFTLKGSCNYTDNDVNSFDRTEVNREERGQFIDNTAYSSLRLNETLANSAYIHFTTVTNISLHTWVTRDVPVLPGFWGIIRDIGEPDDVEFGEDTTRTFTRNAYITVDGVKSNLSSIFGWGEANKYDSRGELVMLYHKEVTASAPTVLATMLSGPDDGSFNSMGLLYAGPNANDFSGSRKCPLQNIGGDYYIDLGDVIGAPEDIEWRVRGHVFLGMLVMKNERTA